MKSLNEKLREVLFEASKKAFLELPIAPSDIEITLATQEKFGHFQCNSAMRFAKNLKRSPREVATEIIEKIENHELFEKLSVEGPGFINICFSAHFLSEQLNQMLHDPRLGAEGFSKANRFVVEFSSPNIAKEMHVGHLRSTIIGDCLARLFEFMGADVVRLNHVGDWGTAFGMLIAYLKMEEPELLSRKKTATLQDLMRFYRSSKERFDNDFEFKTMARQSVVALQGGDREALEAWEMICEISRKAFEEVYRLLDVKLWERGESYYNPMLPKIVEDLEAKGLITLSDGAKCVFHEGFAIPLMVQKSDGGYNYDTTDMAAMLHRVKEERAERIIVVTDGGQSLHFDLVYATALKAGYIDPKKVRFDHVPFGVVLGEDGKKFKTRSGHVERLIDLLTRAVAEAKRILQERQKENDVDAEDLGAQAEILGIDAVKYADLSCNRKSDYVFSYDRMLRFEGNTAAFILYSFVRIGSIRKKIGNVNIDELLKNEKIVLQHPSEIGLGLHLLRFPEVLQALAQDLMPHYLTDYLYLLAQKFNQFFRDCRVQNDPAQSSRLLLCELASRILSQGLHILGLKTLDRM